MRETFQYILFGAKNKRELREKRMRIMNHVYIFYTSLS